MMYKTLNEVIVVESFVVHALPIRIV